jgi:hypothetical protein
MMMRNRGVSAELVRAGSLLQACFAALYIENPVPSGTLFEAFVRSVFIVNNLFCFRNSERPLNPGRYILR